MSISDTSLAQITDAWFLGSYIAFEYSSMIFEKSFRNNFDFYFISEDTHFSKKYINRFGGIISQPITDKIKKLFDIKCVRIREFFDLIRQQQLNVSK